mgnify:CR=1 FL=1
MDFISSFLLFLQMVELEDIHWFKDKISQLKYSKKKVDEISGENWKDNFPMEFNQVEGLLGL